MIYLTSLALCLFLAIAYDILGYTKNKWHWYYLLMVWFVVVSGFQYMVGTDITEYIDEYNHYYNELRFDVGDIEGKRQPGWILLCYVCRQVTEDITLLKLIQATFVNVSIFVFFRREAKYPFLCLVFYAISSYLMLNFNVLRQSMSLGFALYAISYYKKNLFISFVFLWGAYMFHNSALILLFFPVFGLIRYNKYTLFLLSIIPIFLIYFLFAIDINLIFDYVFDIDYMNEGISEIGQVYVNSDRYGVQETKFGYVRFFRAFMILLVVVYYIWKYEDVYLGGLGLLYLFFLVLSFIMPIFFRFGTFYEIPFYAILSKVIVEYPQNRLRQIKYVVYFCMFAIYSFFPYKEYTQKYDGSSYRYIDQYYPYHCIFEPNVEENLDHKKMQFFKHFRL